MSYLIEHIPYITMNTGNIPGTKQGEIQMGNLMQDEKF